MKRLFTVGFLFFAFSAMVQGLKVTEIMYAPNQTLSDTDGEWIELYNDGLSPLNLTSWKIDNYDFDDIVLGQGEYIIVARELTDTTDNDTESFEAVWGNNDGIWNSNDGYYKAVDGYFSLGEIDTINVSDGITSVIASYNSSIGANKNGKTLELNNESVFVESKISGGTPGMENSVNNNGDTIKIEFAITNNFPLIKNIEITPDDSTQEGIQIMPNINTKKNITVRAFVEDLNGFEDIISVYAFINNISIKLSFSGNATNAEGVFVGYFALTSDYKAGTYTVNVTASDLSSASSLTASFEYLGVISTTLSTYSLNFGSLNPGELSEAKDFVVSNSGNTAVDIKLNARLDYGSEGIGLGSIEALVGESWMDLAEEKAFAINPGGSKPIGLRIKAPQASKAKSYKGSVIVTSIAR